MCAAAIHWSKLGTVYFGATIADAQQAGFSELTLPAKDLYKQGHSRVVIFDGILHTECRALLDRWKSSKDRKAY